MTSQGPTSSICILYSVPLAYWLYQWNALHCLQLMLPSEALPLPPQAMAVMEAMLMRRQSKPDPNTAVATGVIYNWSTFLLVPQRSKHITHNIIISFVAQQSPWTTALSNLHSHCHVVTGLISEVACHVQNACRYSFEYPLNWKQEVPSKV